MEIFVFCVICLSVIVMDVNGDDSNESISDLVERKVRENLQSVFKNQELQNAKIRELESVIKNQEKRILSLERECKHRQKKKQNLNELMVKSNTLGNNSEPAKESGYSKNDTINSEEYSFQWNSSNRLPKVNYGNKKKRLLTVSTPTNAIAFYAYMSKNEVNPGQHHTFIFDVVKTNVRTVYNKNNGMFTAPVHGYYVFAWTVVCNPHGYVYSEIVINSEPVGGILTNSDIINEVHTVTGIVVAEVNVGDVVYIRTNPNHPVVGNILSHKDYRTSFSGWKLY